MSGTTGPARGRRAWAQCDFQEEGVHVEGLSRRVYVCVGGPGELGRVETVVCVKQMNKSVVSNSI